MTIVYVINYLKPFGEKGLPVYGYGENDTHVVDVLRDDCECTRYNINAIRISHRVCPEQILEVHVVKKNNDVCDKWIKIDDFDMETIFCIIENIKFQ